MRRIAASLALLAAAPLAAQSPSAPPAWTRGATCYEVFVRSFQDSDGDGIGDLKGLISRLDYINDGKASSQRDLGARCIWLMPIDESPSYHGYDVTDYYAVEKDYGTRADFKQLMAEAHKRGIKVLVDLVLNHSSSEHPYFQAALRDTASPYRAWYRFSRTKPDEKGPWGQEVWHKSSVRDEWYYGVFWSGMPDLNYDTPAVREEANRVARFWVDSMGVDGFRLDAVPYLVETGTKLANTAGTHEVLRDWAANLRKLKPDAYTVGEVWDNIDTQLPYYPDQLTSYFTFELADAIIDAVRKGSSAGLLAPVLHLQRDVPDQRWSPFLRNHDGTRTRTQLGGDMKKARLASAILLTLPGLPFVYYGEEIGMTGDKPDERLRTPMQWTRANHGGFTTGTPWEALQPDSQAVTVEAESRDPRSILALHRRLIHLRAANTALGTGELVPLATSDSGVAAWVRRDGNRAVVAVANLTTQPKRAIVVSWTAGDRVLASGRYSARALFGPANGNAPAFVVDGQGRVARWTPQQVLQPQELYLFELTARAAGPTAGERSGR